MLLIIKFILAHLIADFFLQPKNWVEDKEENKIQSKKLYWHFLIYAIVFPLILWDTSLWKAIVIILISHFVIDILKLYVQTEKTKRLFFFIDQFLHFVVLFIVWYFNQNEFGTITFYSEPKFLIILTAAAFLTIPGSIIIKNILQPWQPKSIEGVTNAGMYIGIVERLLILIFILFAQWQAVGFLLTAKSVFRFKDIQDGKDRTITEYILLGTLVSYGIAILTGIIVINLIK